jgi:DNA-binding response OmpR family regulator
MTSPPILLIGTAAEALAPRLELSGYCPSTASGADAPRPAAVVLSPDCAERLPALRQRWGAIPMLLGVAADSVAGRRHCLLSGADDFWLSRLGPSDVLTRLRLHLGLQNPLAAPGDGAPECWRLADLEVDPANGTARRGQRPVKLTSREYQLLVLLMRNPGRVVSRQEILAAIWADQQSASSNVIEVYVRYLRRKLEAGGERRLIHTVRGNGYCLSERIPPPRDTP